MSPLRVAIADDHYLVREGTRRLLEESGDVDVVAAVENAEQLLTAVERLGPDAVVTDIRMPPDHQMEGIEAAHRIRSDHPSVGVVVLSQYANSMYAFELFKEGTAGLAYLLKDRVGDLDELLRAVRAVADGGSVVDPIVVDELMNRRRNGLSLLDTLTEREAEVLAKMAEGLSNGAISETLFVSGSAVEKHINSIFAKLGLGPEQTETHRRVAAVITFLRGHPVGDIDESG
jgi:DNA-binding NarL/FixJ family response regulator